MSQDTDTRRSRLADAWEQARLWGPWLGVPLLALLAYTWLGTRLDLRDLPGPASGQLITRITLQAEPGAPPPLDQLLVAWDEASPLGTLADLRLLMTLSAVAAVFGAMLAGRALAGPGAPGRYGAAAAGLAAATFSQVVLYQTWICYDTLALGLGWLGLGLALRAADGGWRALPLAAVGAAAVGLSPTVKEIAEPLRALLLAVPFVAWRNPPRALVLALLCGWTAWYGPTALDQVFHLGAGRGGQQLQPSASLSTALEGLPKVYELLHHPERGRHSLVLPLAALAALGAVQPGRRWPARVAFYCAGLGAVGVTAMVLPQGWLRLRYLAPALLPLLVLAGLAAARGAWLLRRLGPLAWLPPLLLAGTLARDSLDDLHEEAETHAPSTGVGHPDLPWPDPWLYTLNSFEIGTSWTHLAVTGAAELWPLFAEQERPIAVPTLMDERGMHVQAVALLSGVAGLDVGVRRCCPGQVPTEQCALDTLAALDAAGVDLVLPRRVKGDWRFSKDDQWMPRLAALAAEQGRVQAGTEAWDLVPASGAGGPLPCGWQSTEHRTELPTPPGVIRGAWISDLRRE